LYAKEFINSKIYKDWRNFEFWQNVFVFFTKENANPATISNLIDYINGCRLRQGSNFSLKGRTLASMENGMRRWHEDLYAERQRYYYKDIYWEGKNIRDFEMEREEKKYIIKQLISSAELAEESKNLHHCVYSYSGLCENGVASIWSLRIVKEDGSLVERLVTIEERECRLVQIKGSYNRLPNIKEMSIIREWAKSEGLKILLNYF
jgi:hypothetical protein